MSEQCNQQKKQFQLLITYKDGGIGSKGGYDTISEAEAAAKRYIDSGDKVDIVFDTFDGVLEKMMADVVPQINTLYQDMEISDN